MTTDRVDALTRIEEETILGYKAERYLPIKIGEVFKNRYKTIGKLGY